MAVEKNDSANQQIDTSQPKVLRGLVLKGQHLVKTVRCLAPGDDERVLIVNEDDYDPKVHGEKIDKIPKRKKAGKKFVKKEGSDD